MIYRYATLVAWLVSLCLWGCVRNIDPQNADEEVRKLLKDVPGFDWEPVAKSAWLFRIVILCLFHPWMTMPQGRLPQNSKEDAYEAGNNSSILETRQWKKSLPVDTNGTVLLDLETSMELALLHSREFQQQKEALYLSALDVTYERFQLGPVPFAGVSGQVSQEMDEDASDFQTRASAGFRASLEKGQPG